MDDFKQGTLAEALDLLEDKVYETEEGAAHMIERIWCFEDHCPTPALGFYEGNMEWAKEVRSSVCMCAPTRHTHTHVYVSAPHAHTRTPHWCTYVCVCVMQPCLKPGWHYGA